MKKKIFICLLAGCLLTGCGKVTPKLEDGKEALVTFKDGTKYSTDEIWEEVKTTYGLDILLDKIDTKILEDEFKDQKEEIDNYMENAEISLKANFTDEDGNYDEDTLLSQLKNYGYSSIESYLSKQRISYLENKATTNYVKDQIKNSEVKDYYEKNTVGDINCVHILVKPENTDDESSEKAKEKAQSIIDSIKKEVESGKKVKDVFASYKDDDTVTYQELGFFNKDDMVEEFETAAYALKKNEYSKTPVKTTYGYHVILKIDEKEKASLEDSTDSIKEKIASEKISKDNKLSINAMIELRKKYKVDFVDSDINTAYNNYMNYLINQ